MVNLSVSLQIVDESIDSEEWKRGLEYEVLHECIIMEIAFHGAKLDEAGDDTEQGRVHFNAMKALIEMDKTIYYRDESTIRRGWIALRAMEADRKKNQHLPLL